MQWRVLYTAILAAIVAVFALPALACSCVQFSSARDQLRAADVMFIGRAVRSERDWFNRNTIYTTFTVEESLKGDVPRRVRVVQNDRTTCAVQSFEPGARVMLLANRDGQRLLVGPCMFPHFTEAEYRAALRSRYQ